MNVFDRASACFCCIKINAQMAEKSLTVLYSVVSMDTPHSQSFPFFW